MAIAQVMLFDFAGHILTGVRPIAYYIVFGVLTKQMLDLVTFLQFLEDREWLSPSSQENPLPQNTSMPFL